MLEGSWRDEKVWFNLATCEPFQAAAWFGRHRSDADQDDIVRALINALDRVAIVQARLATLEDEWDRREPHGRARREQG